MLSPPLSAFSSARLLAAAFCSGAASAALPTVAEESSPCLGEHPEEQHRERIQGSAPAQPQEGLWRSFGLFWALVCESPKVHLEPADCCGS